MDGGAAPLSPPNTHSTIFTALEGSQLLPAKQSKSGPDPAVGRGSQPPTRNCDKVRGCRRAPRGLHGRTRLLQLREATLCRSTGSRELLHHVLFFPLLQRLPYFPVILSGPEPTGFLSGGMPASRVQGSQDRYPTLAGGVTLQCVPICPYDTPAGREYLPQTVKRLK